MVCSQCGYVFEPLESTCPRCARLGSQSTAVAVKPEPDEELTQILESVVPKIQASVSRNAAERQQPRYEPELGWPLTILLWVVLAINLLGIVGIFLGKISAGNIISYILNLVSAIAMLRCQRWGFYIYGFFTIGPAILAIFFGIGTIINNLFPIATSVAIFYYVLSKWDRFD